LVRGVSPVPSILMTAMPEPPLVKTIFVPSGDHEGSVSVEALFVTRCSFVPSALIVQMSPLLEKASLLPSRDHAGVCGDGWVMPGNGLLFVPSEFTTQI